MERTVGETIEWNGELIPYVRVVRSQRRLERDGVPESTVAVICPACNKLHWHGVGDDLRSSHCRGRETITYYIKE